MTSCCARTVARLGFTLFELLITILIIGILAAIGLAVYNGQRDKARDAQAKAAVRDALTAARAYHAEHETYDPAPVNTNPSTMLEPAPAGIGDPLHEIEWSLTSTTSDVSGGPAANPRLIDVNVRGAAELEVILCAGSKSGKVFCIYDVLSAPSKTLRLSGDTQADATTAAKLAGTTNDW